MKRAFIGFTCLTILLAVILIGGAGLGAAQTSPGPRPTATAISPAPGETLPSSPASPDALPDLIVTDIVVSPESPYVNGTAIVYVTIMNVGEVDIELGDNFFVDLYVNPTSDDLRGLPGIDPYPDDPEMPPPWGVQGIWMRVGVPVVLRATLSGVFGDTGSYDLWAQVDRAELDPLDPHPWGYILESDEENNVFGPEPVTVRTHFAWVQQDHVDFFSNMASTLNTVPIESVEDVIESTPGLEVTGDSALILGYFDEPPYTTWGASGNSSDYNMLEPDFLVNDEETGFDQRFPYIHAATAVDTDADTVPDADLVVIVWEDGQDGPTWGKDVYLRWSDDEGVTWQPAIRVNGDVGYADQKRPSVAVAPNGNIVVAWQDNRSGDFDIYVQVYRYDGAALVADGANFRVDTGASDQDQILPDISVDDESNFYVAWQDRRNLNYDIFAVRSYYSVDPCPSITPDLGFYPESAVSPSEIQGTDADGLYLCWGYDARISDDPGITTQAAPDVTALKGVQVVDIDGYCYSVLGVPHLAITEVVTSTVAYVAVVWEDNREGDQDIYMTYSMDGGETFAVDGRVNNDTERGYDQRAPAVAVNQWTKQFTFSAECTEGTAYTTLELPVTTMHIVWQDFRNSTGPWVNDDPDIYYTTATVQPKAGTEWNKLEVIDGEQQKVNEDDGQVRQSDPDVSATRTALSLAESRGYNAFVAWADWRNYGPGDFANPDIYFRLFTEGALKEFVGGRNVMVNNNARLHDFDTSAYTDFRPDMPPHAEQRHPSISSTLVANWFSYTRGWVYVVWDDDRILNPFANYDVYLARSNMQFGGHDRIFTAAGDVPGEGENYGSGAYISSIFDGGSPETQWYYINWHAVTADGTYITLQTRMGDTRAEVLASDWYPERYPYPDDAISVGAPLQGYDAPGQHIEDALGNTCPENCPTARYIQVRVNFWARDTEPDPGVMALNTPFLFDVILGYEGPFDVYLPLLFKSY